MFVYSSSGPILQKIEATMRKIAGLAVAVGCVVLAACTPSGMSVETGTATKALTKAGMKPASISCEILQESVGSVSKSYVSSCKDGANGKKFKVESWYPYADDPQADAFFTINGRMHRTRCYWSMREVNGKTSYTFSSCAAPVAT